MAWKLPECQQSTPENIQRNVTDAPVSAEVSDFREHAVFQGEL